jgi:hypothetical protein
MINTIKKSEEVEYIESITCDVCKTTYSDILDLQEFHHIDFVCGYNSRFGDGTNVKCDICQGCLDINLGDYLRYE